MFVLFFIVIEMIKFNAEQVKNEIVEWIRDWFEKNGKILVESNYRQARFPEGSIVLENGLGEK